MKLLAELKRRNVIRMAGLYLVGAWLVVQVASTILSMFARLGVAHGGDFAGDRLYPSPGVFLDFRDHTLPRLLGAHDEALSYA